MTFCQASCGAEAVLMAGLAAGPSSSFSPCTFLPMCLVVELCPCWGLLSTRGCGKDPRFSCLSPQSWISWAPSGEGAGGLCRHHGRRLSPAVSGKVRARGVRVLALR